MVTRFHYNDTVYQQLLLDELPTDEQTEVTEHVEGCESCQSKLESLSQSDVSWEDVRRYLNGDDPATTNTSSTIGFNRSKTQASLEPVGFLANAQSDEAIGQFGRYEIKEILGRGGMGVVLRGYDPALNRHSAIKVLAPELATHSAARNRFSREAKSAAAVVHEHVVPIQTVDEEQGLPYFVMPVVEGRSLEERVNERGPLEVKEILRIGMQAASGLGAAHAQGLVHRDVKPANILLENGVERVMITDFGLARAADDASMTRSGVIAGTPQYMSPEQSRGLDVDSRSDLFSLGSVLYFMCSGHSPFRAETTMGVLHRIVNDAPRSIRAINPDVPVWLEAIINRLLSKDVDGRYQSAEEVADILERWLAHLQQPDKVAPPEKVTEVVRPALLTSWKLIPLCLTLALFAVAAVVIVLETSKGTLTIDCPDGDIPIRIMKGDEVVRRMTVRQGGGKTRIAAGEYVVEIDGENDGLSVENGRVVLSRGGKAVVSIVSRDVATNPTPVTKAKNKAQLRIAGPRGMHVHEVLLNVPDGGTVMIGSIKKIAEGAQTKGSHVLLGTAQLIVLCDKDVTHFKFTNIPGFKDAIVFGSLDLTYRSDQTPSSKNPVEVDFSLAVLDALRRGKSVMWVYHVPHGEQDTRSQAAYYDTLREEQVTIASIKKRASIVAVLRVKRYGVPNELSPSDVQTRLDGIAKLVQSPDPNFPALLQLLTDSDQSVRNAALVALRKLKKCQSIYATTDDLTLAEARKEQRRWQDIIDSESPQEYYQQVDIRFKHPAGTKFQWPDYPHQQTLHDYETGVSNLGVRTGRFYRFTIPRVPGHQAPVHPDLEVRELDDAVYKLLDGKLDLTLDGAMLDYIATNEQSVIVYVVPKVGNRRAAKIIYHVSSKEDVVARTEQTGDIVAVLRVNRNDFGELTQQPLAGQSLLDAVRQFNVSVTSNEPDFPQPPLTDEEVIASIRWALRDGNNNFTDKDRRALEMIVEQRVLPKGWGLAGGDGTFVAASNVYLRVWDIMISRNRRERDEVHSIRRRYNARLNGNDTKEPADDADGEGQSLAVAIKQFNDRCQSRGQQSQPSLTEDEVIAAILSWNSRRDEASVSDADFATLQAIAKTRRLPKNCEFELQTHLKPNDRELYDIWLLRLRLNKSDGSGSFAFTLREQFNSVTELKESDIRWGPPAKSGLQVGVRLSPPTSVFNFGQPFTLEFVFRTRNGKVLKGSFPNVYSYQNIEVFDSAGNPIRVVHHSSSAISGAMQVKVGRETHSWDGGSLVVRPASDTADYDRESKRTLPRFYSPSKAIIYAEPGQSCRLRFIVNDPTTGSNEKIKTGEVVFKIAEARTTPEPAAALDLPPASPLNAVPFRYPPEPLADQAPRMICKFRVVDDATGERVTEYNVAAGGKKDDGTWSWTEGTIHVNNHERLDDYDQLTFARAAANACDYLQISANGYVPQQVSETKTNDWSASVIEVRLRRGKQLSGRVVYLGKPVEGTRVFMLRTGHRNQTATVGDRPATPRRSTGMFVRPCYRTKDGKRHAYWALVESFRTDRGPRQRVVAYLARLDEEGRLGVQHAAAADASPIDQQPCLPFAGEDTQDVDSPVVQPQWVTVNAAAVRVENCVQLGGPWLALELIKKIGLDDFFRKHLPHGRTGIDSSSMALVLVICRLCKPSSELHIAEHFYRKSALSQLLGVPAAKVYHTRLYRALDQLLPHKEKLEMFLKNRLGELFELEYDLLLYDVTSTYFEGQAKANPKAKHGYSRDKRSDCKQVCIALVVSRCGMPIGYEVFDGNRTDSTTVEEIVTTMESRYGKSSRVWVMDRGMLSEKNIQFLKQEDRRYIIGTPKSILKKFERELLDESWEHVRQGVEVKLCPSPDGDEETFILCRSRDRLEKEKAIFARFESRIEEGLKKIAASCDKKKQSAVKIAERVGRLRQANSRASRLFDVCSSWVNLCRRTPATATST